MRFMTQVASTDLARSSNSPRRFALALAGLIASAAGSGCGPARYRAVHFPDEPEPTAIPAAEPIAPAPMLSGPPTVELAGAQGAATKPDTSVERSYERPLPSEAILRKGRSNEYANLAPATCRRRLKQARLNFVAHRGPASGVASPVRVSGPLNGIKLRVPSKKSPFGVLDCRLALAVDDFAKRVARHGVVEMRIDNFHRNGAKLPGKRRRSQHAYGLAIDLVSFTLKDGTVLSVEDDWHGRIGTDPCGPNAGIFAQDSKTIRLRNLVCDVARTGLFHHILTPNFNAAHRDHLHLDIKRDNHWYSVN